MSAILTPAKIAASPELFAATFLRILDKEKTIVPFRWNRAQRHFHEQRTGRDLILKARQLGFSTYVQGEMFRRTVTGTRTTITLAHDADTTAKLRLMADRFYQHCKFNDLQPLRKYANASLTTYPEYDSAATIATAGNVQTGRGDTYSDVHGSEVAFWKDAEKIVAGAMQGGSPDVVLESTPNGAQGYFYERCMEALHDDGVWKLHFFPWWWDDGYRIADVGDQLQSKSPEEAELSRRYNLDDGQLQWRRNKIRELGRLFAQEYPEDPIQCFLTSGNSYFGDLSTAFTAPLNPEYDPAHEYYAGLDFGQTNDFTAMPVHDKTAKAQVDFLHVRKLPWSEQRRRIAETYRKWHCKAVIAEGNSIGGPNAEALAEDGLNVVIFNTTNASKADLMAKLYEGIHTDGLKLQDIPVQRHEFNTFVASQTTTGMWRLAAEGDGHDDTVIANGLAWHGCYNPIWYML